MTSRATFAALAIASVLLLPTIGSAAIVPKWQTPLGVHYRVISQVGDLNGDGSYELITGEFVGGAERIGIRSGSTGALLAQTAGTYQGEEFWIVNVDGDDDAEIVFGDGLTDKLNCLQYTVGNSTLAVRWSYLPTPNGVPTKWEFADLDGNGQIYLVFKDETFDSDKFYVRDNNGALVTTIDLTTAPGGTGWTSDLFVDDYDLDGRHELMIKYNLYNLSDPLNGKDVVYVFENNSPVAAEPGVSESRSFPHAVKVDGRERLAVQKGSRFVPQPVAQTQRGGR